ncbi:MAG: CotH kinase family protein, partial [Bacteroidota bacterium]
DNYPAIEGEDHEGSTHVRDEFVQTLAQEGGLKLDLRKVERVVLFLNGEYWGVYGMREKVVDHDYTKEYYNQGKYDLQYLATWETTEVEYGGQKALDDWVRLRDFILENDMTSSANYHLVEDSLNVLSLIDYFLMNQAVVAKDWLNYNTGWWRGLNPDGDHKKWGYILWDLDATFDYYINYTNIPNEKPNASFCDIYPISEAMDEFFVEPVDCSRFGGNNSPYADDDPFFQEVLRSDSSCCANWGSNCQELYDEFSGEVGGGEDIDPEDCPSIQNGTSPYPANDPIFIQVVNDDTFCCEEWDNFCQDIYDELSENGGGGINPEDCASIQNGTSPYPASDSIFVQVINEDAFCCDEWDEFCQEIYDGLADDDGRIDISNCPIIVNGTSPYSVEDEKLASVIEMNPNCCEVWGVSCQNDYDIIGPGQFEDLDDSLAYIPGNIGKHEKIFLKLFEENPEFKQLFYTRFADLMNTTFSCENMNELLERMVAVIEPEMPQQIERWGGTMQEWRSNLNQLRKFIKKRCAFINQEAMACHGEVERQFAVTLSTQPEGIGTIEFNTLEIDDFPWT